MPTSKTKSRTLACARTGSSSLKSDFLGNDGSESSDAIHNHLKLFVQDIANMKRVQESLAENLTALGKRMNQAEAGLKRLGEQGEREYEFSTKIDVRLQQVEHMLDFVHKALEPVSPSDNTNFLPNNANSRDFVEDQEEEPDLPSDSTNFPTQHADSQEFVEDQEEEGYTPRDEDDDDISAAWDPIANTDENQENEQETQEDGENEENGAQDDENNGNNHQYYQENEPETQEDGENGIESPQEVFVVRENSSGSFTTMSPTPSDEEDPNNLQALMTRRWI